MSDSLITEGATVIREGWTLPIILSLGEYAFFMANGKEGMDALQVYMHLLWVSSRQATNQVWATNTYIERGISMSPKRVKKAKSFLRKAGKISDLVRRNEDGTIAKHYIRLHHLSRVESIRMAIEKFNETAGQEITMGAENHPMDIDQQLLALNKGIACNEQEDTSLTPDRGQDMSPPIANAFLELDIDNTKVRVSRKRYQQLIDSVGSIGKADSLIEQAYWQAQSYGDRGWKDYAYAALKFNGLLSRKPA